LVQYLEIEDFTAAEHRILFETIKTRSLAGVVPSPVLLVPLLAGVNFGGLPPAVYLARLVTVGQPAKLAFDYAKQLRDLSGRRAITEISRNLSEAVQNPGSNVLALAGDAVGQLNDVQAQLRDARHSLALLPAAAQGFVEQLAKREKKDIIKTGLTDLDKVLGGWHRGELAIIAGRPSMGKSAFAFSTLRRAAQLGTRSAIFSLEMRREAVLQRLLSDNVWNSQTPIEYERIARQDVSDYEIERLRKVADEMQRFAPLYIDDQPALTVAEISARARRIKDSLERKGETLDVVVVDHLGKIMPSNRYAGNKVHETGEKTGALAVLARELDVAVIALHQINRGVESRDEKRPGMSDLRDSGDVEQDADTVGFLYRPAYYLERVRFDDTAQELQRMELLQAKINDLEFIIAKNRNGPCRPVDLFINIASNAVRDRVM
jgi:replicative DNA helicase